MGELLKGSFLPYFGLDFTPSRGASEILQNTPPRGNPAKMLDFDDFSLFYGGAKIAQKWDPQGHNIRRNPYLSLGFHT